MNRALLPLMIAICVVIAAGLAWLALNRRSAPPPAPPVVRSIELPAFRRITVDGVANLTLVQGNRTAVDLDVPPDVRGVRAVVRNGTLAISASERSRAWAWMFGTRERDRAPVIVVHYRTIDRLDLSGAVKVAAGSMRVDDLAIAASGGSSLHIGALAAKRLEVTGSGALDAHISGRVDDERVSISGAGSYHAEGLTAQSAKVEVSGVAKVVLRVERALDASISGAGNIDYYGDPVVTQAVSGIGRVRRRDSDAADALPSTAAPEAQPVSAQEPA